MQNLFNKLQDDYVFGKYEINTIGKLYSFLTEKLSMFESKKVIPGEDPRDRLLEMLVQPENVGCGHLKLLLTQSEKYGVRRELVAETIKAIFLTMWQNPGAVDYDVLSGGHKEKAALIIKSSTRKPITVDSIVPAIIPNTEEYQTFVYHPQAVEFMRWYNAGILRNNLSLPDSLTQNQLFNQMQTLGNKWLNLTLGRLAAGLPIYEVIFDQKGNFKAIHQENLQIGSVQ